MFLLIDLLRLVLLVCRYLSLFLTDGSECISCFTGGWVNLTILKFSLAAMLRIFLLRTQSLKLEPASTVTASLYEYYANVSVHKLSNSRVSNKFTDFLSCESLLLRV